MSPKETWSGRAVLHMDMDAFFATVEQLDHPEWRGKPVIVGSPEKRGVVSTASYEARAFGVRSGMPSVQASRLCPDAVWAPPRFARYSELSRAVRELLDEASPWVQQASIDEAYLDVTPGRVAAQDPVEVARSIQEAVSGLGLSCSIGLATSRTVAKIASDHVKPAGLTVVRPGEEASFLSPLPVSAMPGIGRVSAERMRSFGVRTLGELASLDEATARAVLGPHGPSTVERARGHDDSPVRPDTSRKSLSMERTFSQDLRGRAEVEEALRGLVGGVASRLRGKALAGRTATLKLRYGDFTTRTVRRTLPRATDLEDDLLPVALTLLGEIWTPGTGLRLMGFGVSGFGEPARQLELGEDQPVDERQRRLARSLDDVRARFGEDAVRRGSKRRRREP